MRRPFHQEGVVLLCLVLLSGGLRLGGLGEWPGGLYRDEAYNGLDALSVVEGARPLFFPANNGREPAYIYLTAVSVALLGRTPLAVRLPAALVSTLATVAVWALARAWFGRRVGLLAAAVWTLTLWPLHLGRIGFRAGLLPLALAVTFWLGTQAYRRSRAGQAGAGRWWVAAGVLYGLTYYTYLAARFTPLLLLTLLIYLWLTGRGRGLWPGGLGFVLGSSVIVAPLAITILDQPDLMERSSQVSILNPAINQGDVWGTLARHTWQGLGMFVWRGDEILRHNPAGRPVFDLFLALPFVWGVGWCVYHWRRPAAMTTLLWTGVMLGPTILAEDTPHFLRAVGVLPAVLIFPALGLSQLWSWSTLPANLAVGLSLITLFGAGVHTLYDYRVYVQSPDTAYLFEAAARQLAEAINKEPATVGLYMDQRYEEGWPSLRFLAQPAGPLSLFSPETGLPATFATPAVVFVWPYADHTFLTAVPSPAQIVTAWGPLARNDLEPQAVPLYARYQVDLWEQPDIWPVWANFDNQLQLRQATVVQPEPTQVLFELAWSTPGAVMEPVTVFVHVLGPAGVLAQSDKPPADGLWPWEAWRPGVLVHDQHQITLPGVYDPSTHQLVIGVYRQRDLARLPVLDSAGVALDDAWVYPGANSAP